MEPSSLYTIPFFSGILHCLQLMIVELGVVVSPGYYVYFRLLLRRKAMPEKLDITDPYSNCNTIYIPTDGGKKRHSNPECSGMHDPRKVSDRNAEELGFDPCKKCYIYKAICSMSSFKSISSKAITPL